MVGPMKATIASFIPKTDGMSRKMPPQKTRLRRSLTLRPIVPARVIVSAWKLMVATELKAREPAMPTRKAIAVGKAAKPKLRARMPCGMPLMTTARAVKRSVNMKTHAPFKSFRKG